MIKGHCTKAMAVQRSIVYVFRIVFKRGLIFFPHIAPILILLIFSTSSNQSTKNAGVFCTSLLNTRTSSSLFLKRSTDVWSVNLFRFNLNGRTKLFSNISAEVLFDSLVLWGTPATTLIIHRSNSQCRVQEPWQQ